MLLSPKDKKNTLNWLRKKMQLLAMGDRSGFEIGQKEYSSGWQPSLLQKSPPPLLLLFLSTSNRRINWYMNQTRTFLPLPINFSKTSRALHPHHNHLPNSHTHPSNQGALPTLPLSLSPFKRPPWVFLSFPKKPETIPSQLFLRIPTGIKRKAIKQPHWENIYV